MNWELKKEGNPKAGKRYRRKGRRAMAIRRTKKKSNPKGAEWNTSEQFDGWAIISGFPEKFKDKKNSLKEDFN